MAVGTSYILLSDTSQRKLGFLRIRDARLVQLQLDEAPGQAVYRSAKFFIRLGEKQVGLYHEEALTEVKRWSLQREIVDIQLDRELYTLIFTRDSLLYESRINYNTQQMENVEVKVDYDKIRYPTYKRASFGKEYIREVFIRDQQLSPSNSPKADDFEVDFFESNIYFQRNDSLFTFHILTGATRSAGILDGKMLKAHFFQNSIGK